MDLILSEAYIKNVNPKAWLRRALHLKPEQIAHAASLTVGQRENPMWAAVRKLRFTASNFGQILASGDKRCRVKIKSVVYHTTHESTNLL